MLDNCSFSGYWRVDGNPKSTAKQGHLSSVTSKKLDLFFNENTPISQFKDAQLEYVNLPSHKYLQNLNKIETAYTKFGLEVSPSVFIKLATIWTSKPFLFKEAKDRVDAKHYTWLDCVRVNNFEKALTDNSGRVALNKYGGKGTAKMKKFPFKNFLGKGYPGFYKLDKYISGCVIKVPVDLVDAFNDFYAETLKWVDSNYPIYDEEVVLSNMYHLNPEMFKIINE